MVSIRLKGSVPRRAVAVVLVASLSVPLVAPTFTASPAAAANAVFDPITHTSLGTQTVFGQVVTDGRGMFHSVVRSDEAMQQIVYRRSVDAGRTWVILGRFAGDSGGATKPAIAVDGDHLSIAFLGLWCNPAVPTSCDSAPYLVSSADAGVTWTSPVRFDTYASAVKVAVDSDRTWFAWERSGEIKLRGTTDGGALFDSEQYIGSSVQLAAADGLMVVAWEEHGSGNTVVPRAAVAKGADLGDPQTVAPGWAVSLGGWEASVATQNGRAHVLLVDRPADPVANPPSILVASTNAVDSITPGVTNVSFNAPVEVMPKGYTAAISATRGTVAVAVGVNDGTTSIATSLDNGASFDGPIGVTSTSGHEPLVSVGVARPPSDRPVARFTWSVDPHYTDTDLDGLPNPANNTDNTVDSIQRVAANRTMTMRLDGCRSLPSAGHSITGYSWFIGSTPLASDPGLQCRATVTVADGDAVDVRMVVNDDSPSSDFQQQHIAPRDYVLVSVGDSVASGEGTPQTFGATAWQDGPCHRSELAGPALAARQLEESDPHSSVTFIQLACSGASIADQPTIVGDDPASGGMLDAYQGIVPTATSLRPAQLDQMSSLTGTRAVDALMVSIGANDVKFSDVVIGCFAPSCNSPTSQTRLDLEARQTVLANRYGNLAAAITAKGVAANRVRLTEYFDPTTDDLGLPDMRCAADPAAMVDLVGYLSFPTVATIVSRVAAGGLIDDDETRWAQDAVIGKLNAAGATAAAKYGWQRVGGIASKFARHGYCATDHWIVRVGDSLTRQGDPWGAFHPNIAGQRVYGDALFNNLKSTLTPLPATTTGNASGPTYLGDVMVMTTTTTTTTSSAVDMTSGRPQPLSEHLLDRVVPDATTQSNGGLGPAGPPAVDNSTAVGMWTELGNVAPAQFETVVSQLAVQPNAAVREVDIVQAPANGTRLVAGRASVVEATVDLGADGPTALDVTTRVVATDSSGVERVLVPAATDRLTIAQGQSHLILPNATTFAANDGDRVKATVTISDPAGASPTDAFDNQLTSASPQTATTRPLHIQFGRASVGATTVSCQDVKATADRMTAYARAALPVDSGGITAGLFCGLLSPVGPTDQGMADALLDADALARVGTFDMVVLVVPDGWLVSAYNALGVAGGPGFRGIIVEASTADQVLAHEISHNFGINHTQSFVPARGVRVDRRQEREGFDWMYPGLTDKAWTGGANWDALVTAIGGPDRAPAPPNPNGSSVFVRGTIVHGANGTWGLTGGQWIPVDAGPATDPVANGSLDPSRLSVQQFDAAGNPLTPPLPIGVGAAGGMFVTGSTEPASPLALTFATRVPIATGARSVSLLLDGTVAETRVLSNPPTVTLTSPTPGTSVARGDPLTVSWDATDPDGDPLTATVFGSDDDGATWRPLAEGVVGASVTMPVPQDLHGNTVRIRVTVSDGIRLASDTSGQISAEPTTSLGVEKVVFVREANFDQLPSQLYTMDPDGSGVTQVPLPSAATVAHLEPTIGIDGRIYFTSNLTTPQFTIPLGDFTTDTIWSVKPDGSELQRITAPYSDTTYWPTNAAGQSLGTTVVRCPTLSPDATSLAWLGGTAIDNTSSIWVAHRVGTTWSRPTAILHSGPQSSLGLHPSFPGTVAPSSLTFALPSASRFDFSVACPRWAPDSASVALIAGLRYFSGNASSPTVGVDATAVVRVAADGTQATVISPRPTYVQGTGAYANFQWQMDFNNSVDWASGPQLTVSRGFQPLATFNPGNGTGSSPQDFGVFRLDAVAGVFSRVTPLPDASWLSSTRPTEVQVSPSGAIYGGVTGPVDPGCNSARFDLGVIEPSTGVTNRITPAHSGTCQPNDFAYDWGLLPGSGGGTTAPPALVPDPSSAPDDPNSPVVQDVTTVTAPSASPAPGADVEPGIAASVATPITGLVVPADASTTIKLTTSNGTLQPFEIVTAPPETELHLTVDRPAGRSVVTGDDGLLTLTPAPGFRGATQFTYSVFGDPQHSATVDLTVVGNTPPQANPDALSATAGTLSVFPPSVLTGNDVDPDSTAPLTVVSVFGCDNGSAWLATDGQLHILPASAGTASFSYVIVDSQGATAEGTVSVAISGPPNHPPSAVDDSFTTTFETALTVVAPGVLTGDSDPDGDVLSVTQWGSPSVGTISATAANGAFTYSPPAGFVGTDTFPYTISDGRGGLATATASVSVTSTTPGAPTSLVVTPGDTTLAVAWSPPASNGGANISGYTVAVTPTAGGATTTLAPTNTSVLVTGLTNATPYRVVVVANNSNGPSQPATGQGTPRAPSSPGLSLIVDAAAITPATTRTASATVLVGRWTASSAVVMGCGDDVTIKVGALTETIAGSRFTTLLGICTYVAPKTATGYINLVTLDFRHRIFSIAGHGRAPTFVPFVNPVVISLTIGDDVGTTTATFRKHEGSWTFPR